MYARSSLAIALGCFIVSGCDPGGKGNKKTDVDNLGGDTDDSDWPGFNPKYFGVSTVSFGFDFENLQAVPVVTQNEAGNPVLIPISLTVLLLEAEAAETGNFMDGNHCEVIMTRTEPLPYADWTGDAGAWFAFEMPGSTGESDCHVLEFDPDDWGNEPLEHVTKWTWGAGINALTPDAVALLGDEYETIEPWVQGGGSYWEALPEFGDAKDPEGVPIYDEDGYIDVGITFAYQVDDAFNLVFDDGEKVLIPASEVAQPNDNALTAYYEVQVNRFLKPVQHLQAERD